MLVSVGGECNYWHSLTEPVWFTTYMQNNFTLHGKLGGGRAGSPLQQSWEHAPL